MNALMTLANYLIAVAVLSVLFLLSLVCLWAWFWTHPTEDEKKK